MNRHTKTIVISLVALALLPFIFSYTGKVMIHIRHRMQEHYAEIHGVLSGEDEDQSFGDSSLTDAQIAARDNVVTPIATPKGVLSWKTLAQAQTKVKQDSKDYTIMPVYNDAIKKLDQQNLTAKGFMFPLDSFGKQTHFLLSPYPSSCPFCRPAGPNELIEVKPTEPMEFTYEAITVKGKFELLKNSDDIQQGMFYRMDDAALK